ETFRNFIQELGGILKDTFNRVMEYVQPAIDAVSKFFGDIKEKISGFMAEEGPQLTEAFETIGSIIGAVAGYIGDQIRNAFETIKVLVYLVMPLMNKKSRTEWVSIKLIFTGDLAIILGEVRFFGGLFIGNFFRFWDGVFKILKGVKNMVWGFVR